METDKDVNPTQEQARAHPLRRAILALLTDHAALPALAVSRELSSAPSLSVVAYHLRVLCAAKLVKGSGDPADRIYSLV